MSRCPPPRQVHLLAAVCAACTWAAPLHAAERPSVVVAPFAYAQGVGPSVASRVSGMVADGLEVRSDVRSVPVPGGPRASKPLAAARKAFVEGEKALAESRFEEASNAFAEGVEQALSELAFVDVTQVLEAWVKQAAADIRRGKDERAEAALTHVARLAPEYDLPGGYPPVFVREFERAKKRVEKLPRTTLVVDGPPGSVAFIDGRDLGMVPVDESLPAGMHVVQVEGPRGERFGQRVELQPGVPAVRVRAELPASQLSGAALGVSTWVTEEALTPLAQLTRQAGADYAVVGVVFRAGADVQLGTAVYSAERQGFVPLARVNLGNELSGARQKLASVVEEVLREVSAPRAPAPLPFQLGVGAGVPVAALPSTSVLSRESTSPELQGGTPAWVWVAIGLGVAAAAGGTYYGVTEASKPVTGTVTARWER